MNDGIAVIAETQQETNKKVDKIDERLVHVEDRLINVEDRLINVEDRLINVEDRLMSVEDDVIEIKHRLSEKIDRDEFNKMEKRMVKLEKLVFTKLAEKTKLAFSNTKC
jgi:septal ring factor EnvC (AmiA/AmiB activator)